LASPLGATSTGAFARSSPSTPHALPQPPPLRTTPDAISNRSNAGVDLPATQRWGAPCRGTTPTAPPRAPGGSHSPMERSKTAWDAI